MSTLLFVTHPEVAVEPGRPVPFWHLSARGVARMRAFAAAAATQNVRAVWSSDETKALEGAAILAKARGLGVSVHVGLRENDRRSTGFLPPAEFDAVADAFFGRPEESVRGWERAVDAQRRVRAAFEAILAAAAAAPAGDVAIVAHGAVGTLLLCHLAGRPIGRDADQSFPGHYWSYSTSTRRVEGWRPIAPG